ncbi:AbiV family abortive infection protein [Tenacibaculum aquimarinum]|uniref:AbiV family abortive infection protein n=1 Tax=Tenacibaculum aquimarinum TaxID=2910675 RepID=UPI001F0ACB6B|nr:AbiV family abortive infection protein [Tenacibaculum aquimarinum]MCH3884390.1 AbiV family abortive infection protein [Tenacibaculum aquimarinum]
MQKFINLSPIQSKGLDKTIYKNALNLKKDAILIAEKRKSYSSASSLLILSSEECVKSILVLLHSEKYNIYKIKGANKFFSDHIIRHQLGKFIELTLGLFETWYTYNNSKPSKLFESKNPKLNNMLNGLLNAYKAIQPLSEVKPNIEYLEKFNITKNKGFYVDYRDKLIDPKEEVTHKDYILILKITNRIFKFNKLLRILFHDRLIQHIEKDKIEKMKENIREFIDHGLPLVSFDELKKNNK